MSKKYSNENIDERLIGRKLIRVGNYITAKEKILFKCSECNFNWLGCPDRIINRGDGCPNCNPKKKIGLDIVKKILEDKKIELCEPYEKYL